MSTASRRRSDDVSRAAGESNVPTGAVQPAFTSRTPSPSTCCPSPEGCSGFFGGNPSRSVCQQFPVRTDEVDGVAGPKPRFAPWVQLDRCVLSGDHDDAGLGRHLLHRQPVEFTALGYMHCTDHERALRDRERAQHLQAHRGADEPRARPTRRWNGRSRKRTAAQPPSPARGRKPGAPGNVGAAVDLGHHSRPQHLGQHDPGFDVDHVVTGQHRHRAGAVDAR